MLWLRSASYRFQQKERKVLDCHKISCASASKKFWRSEKRSSWRKENYEKLNETRRNSRLKKKFGLSPEDFQKMMILQNGVCAICRKQCTLHKSLSVDHCHKTGKVRGLLCNLCNRGLGLFFDSSISLRAASEYIEKSGS